MSPERGCAIVSGPRLLASAMPPMTELAFSIYPISLVFIVANLIGQGAAANTQCSRGFSSIVVMFTQCCEYRLTFNIHHPVSGGRAGPRQAGVFHLHAR